MIGGYLMKWSCEKCAKLNRQKANFCQACGEKKTAYVVPADKLTRNSFFMLSSYANSLRVLAIGGSLFGLILILNQILHEEDLMMASMIGFGMMVVIILFLGLAEILDWMIQVEKENYQMAKAIKELTTVNKEILNWLKVKKE